MCGRLSVHDDPLAQQILGSLGIAMQLQNNEDLRPSDLAATLIWREGLSQLDARWGIRPQWSKQLLINAQAETVAEKRTFRHAFRKQRCVIPCSGWYEWQRVDAQGESAERTGTKRKLLFTDASDQALYMAGLLFPAVDAANDTSFVSLTCQPDTYYRAFHHRMPLLLKASEVETWLRAKPTELGSLLQTPDVALSVLAC